MSSSSSSLPVPVQISNEEAWRRVLQDSCNRKDNNSNGNVAGAASESPVCTVHMRQQLAGLRTSLTCPICDHIYNPPVATLLACGHSFCQVCIHAKTCNSWKCPVEGCGASIMVTGKSKGGYSSVNPSLESAVVAVNNIVQALARAKPSWWKQDDDDEIMPPNNNATTTGVDSKNNNNDDDDDDDDTTIDLQAAAGQQLNGKTESTNNPFSLSQEDDDETIFETAPS